jgi:hypothetical protein
MYEFRRSPFQMNMNGNRLDLSFTGMYKITGSSRACVNGTILSPWSPSCRCGFSEGERKVLISFTSFFDLQPNYILKTRIFRNEPKALNKCEVCFWGQDVTTTVLQSLKAELDASKKSMEDSFSRMNLRPYLQKAWNMLGQVYSLPGVGYFSLNPKTLRMENLNAKNNLLNLNIGISATPVISFIKPGETTTALPPLNSNAGRNGFNIYLEAALQYDSLSNVLNSYMVNKRFDLSEGILKKYIIIKDTKISGTENGDMNIQIEFTGSFNGTVLFTGTPEYNPETKTVVVNNLDYDLHTKNFLLKTAKWLFNKKIKSELKQYTTFSLKEYYDTAAKSINAWINKEWTKGVKGNGQVSELKLIGVYALPDHILIRSNCNGKLNLTISDIPLSFNN